MDFSLISNTFITIFTTDVFFYCILGVVAGMVIGTLPGLSATMGIAILTPLTFWLEPAQGMAVLLGIYNSCLLYTSYIAKIYEEVKDRPRYILSDTCGEARHAEKDL